MSRLIFVLNGQPEPLGKRQLAIYEKCYKPDLSTYFCNVCF